MINVTKISNQEDGFILNYYTNGNNEIVIVNSSNIVSELNSAFAANKKAQEEMAVKQAAYMNQCAQGSALGAYPSTLNAQVRMAAEQQLADSAKING